MPLREIVESVERSLARVHLIWWIVEVATALPSTLLAGQWAQLSGLPWPLVMLTGLGGLTAASVGVLVLHCFVTRLIPAVYQGAKDRKRMLPLIGMVILGAGFLGCAVWYFWPSTAASGPIVWNFTEGASPIAFSGGTGDPLWADAFQLPGENVTDDPVSIDDAFVRSDVTMQILPFQAVGGPGGTLLPVNGSVIIPHGKFILIAAIPSVDPKRSQGIIAEQLRVSFRAFTVIIKYDNGKEIVLHFPSHDVDELISNSEKVVRAALQRGLDDRKAGIVPRSQLAMPNTSAPYYAEVNRILSGYDQKTIEWIRRMADGNRPVGIPDEIWKVLFSTGMFNQDNFGPNAIEAKYRPAIQQWLKNNQI